MCGDLPVLPPNLIERYALRRLIGKGAYGTVYSAKDVASGQDVAVKRVASVFVSQQFTKRVLRELQLQRTLNLHSPLACALLLDVGVPQSAADFEDVFIVMERFQSDLHAANKANRFLPDQCKYVMQHLLRHVCDMHRLGIVHRDLKPQNVLINNDCSVKLCDLGMAQRMTIDVRDNVMWSDYATTRWYRPPELCDPISGTYDTAADIWSLGCIFAELITGRTLFPGKYSLDQLRCVVKTLGMPPLSLFDAVPNALQRAQAQDYVTSLCSSVGPATGLDVILGDSVDPAASSLLRSMLQYDPRDRVSAADALRSAYFSDGGGEGMMDNSSSSHATITTTTTTTTTITTTTTTTTTTTATETTAFDNSGWYNDVYLTIPECRSLLFNELTAFAEGFLHQRRVRIADIDCSPIIERPC